MGEKELSLKAQEFISPVFYNRHIATYLDGIVCKFQIPSMGAGWYKFKAVDAKSARSTGKADLIEIEQYLKYFEKIRMVLIHKKSGVYLAIPDKSNRFNLPYQEPIPVFLTDDSVMDFDRIIARYDGANFWYESIDQGNDPSKAEYLRTCLETLQDPTKIKFSGLTSEEKLAYTLRFSFDQTLVEERKKGTLQGDVEHAGGKLLRYTEKSDHYSVTYTVDGETFTSHISKDPKHFVIAAGICLSGHDKHFDLKSLITVVREAKKRRVVHRFHIEDPGFRDPYSSHDPDYDDDNY
jgi:hypothetical protein